MKFLRLLPVTLLFSYCAIAQKKPVAQAPADIYDAIDKKALEISPAQTHSTPDIAQYINATFTRDDDKIRAAFIWVTTNIRYDVENMYTIRLFEKPEERIVKTLTTHQGVCFDYATVFCNILNCCNIRSHVVLGYVRSNGAINNDMSHTWCVVNMDNDWYVFDPTWGAGYCDNNTYYPKLDNQYFKTSPSESIKTHMPFDPMWECLTHPITNAEFCQGETQGNVTRPIFDYADSIKTWDQQSDRQRNMASARRTEQNGIENPSTYKCLTPLICYQIISDYNNCVSNFNDFIAYRNNRFKPRKPDAEIKNMIDIAVANLEKAKARIHTIENPKEPTASHIAGLNKSIDAMQTRVDEQRDFVAKYLSKGAMGRKMMFTNYTWMGIPLN